MILNQQMLQIFLVWLTFVLGCRNTPLSGRRVLLVERKYSGAVTAAADQLAAWLRREGATVLDSAPGPAHLSGDNVHLLVCLGGDGTLLEAPAQNLRIYRIVPNLF